MRSTRRSGRRVCCRNDDCDLTRELRDRHAAAHDARADARPAARACRRRLANDSPSHAGVLSCAVVRHRASSSAVRYREARRPSDSHDGSRRTRGGDHESLLAPATRSSRAATASSARCGRSWRRATASSSTALRRTGTRALGLPTSSRRWRDHPKTRGVTVVHSDTSTGVQNDVASDSRLTQSRGILGLVDCISSLGGAPFAFDDWGADVVVTASQKCLMSSPGLAFVAVSDRAWKAYDTARPNAQLLGLRRRPQNTREGPSPKRPARRRSTSSCSLRSR